MKILPVIAAGFILGTSAFAQMPGFGGPEVLNQPFSADAITTLDRTLADGTHITRQTMAVKMYRDSAGRTRSDRTPGVLMVGQPALPTTTLIKDPLAGYSYVLDSVNKVAHRTAIPKLQAARKTVEAPANKAVSPPSTPRAPQMKREDLGTQTMQGLTVKGTRTTTTLPAGSIGNDRDIVSTTEIWNNPELRLMILQRRSDPRNGNSSTSMENLSRTQPDPSLFTIPLDYKIVDDEQAQ